MPAGGTSATVTVQAQVTASQGAIDTVTVERIPETGAWRVAFRYLPDGNRTADLHCFLQLYGQALTETWTYLWTP